MRPTLRQLQYLVAIADTGRFGDAARRMNVSQPSLSAQIADVEAVLGGPLVERGRRGAFMTPLGAEIVQRARLILRDVEDIKALARRAEVGLVGRIRLGVLPSVGPYLLPSVTKRLHALYPDFRLAVQEHRTIDLAAGLLDGQLDTVISTAEDHQGHVALPLFEEAFWICAAPDDILSKDDTPVDLSALSGRPLISLGHGHRLSQLIANVAREAGGHVSVEYEGTSLDAARQMAIMGAGVAVLPSLYATAEARRDPDLVVRRIAHAVARRTISLVWREKSPLADRFQALADVLKETAEELLKR